MKRIITAINNLRGRDPLAAQIYAGVLRFHLHEIRRWTALARGTRTLPSVHTAQLNRARLEAREFRATVQLALASSGHTTR